MHIGLQTESRNAAHRLADINHSNSHHGTVLGNNGHGRPTNVSCRKGVLQAEEDETVSGNLFASAA